MRSSPPAIIALLGGLVALGGAGCGRSFAVVPRGGAPSTIASPSGVAITVLGEPWRAAPSNLWKDATPIAVELYNGSQEEVRVSYADFALTDESTARYPGINVFVPSEGEASSEGLREPRPILLAHGGRFGGGGRLGGGARSRGGFGHGTRSWGTRRWGARSWGTRRWGTRSFIPGRSRFGITFRTHHRWYGHGAWRPVWGRSAPTPIWRPNGWTGFLIAQGLRGYFGDGEGLSYWTDAVADDPTYDASVVWYPEEPTADLLAFALPEGVIAPGGRVNGFLYFVKATDGARVLTLTWQLHTARDGRDLGSTNVILDVLTTP